MSKMLQVTDPQYDWFCARARSGRTMASVIDSVIKLVEHHEADLAKYQAWVKATGLPLSIADKAFLHQQKQAQEPPIPQPTPKEESDE